MTQSRLYCPEEEFTWRLRSRMPMNVGFTFSNEQLQALRSAFGNRFQSRHTIDVRGRIYLPWSRYYVVVQFGRDRRHEGRRAYGRERVRTWLDSATCGLALAAGAAALAWFALPIF